MKFQIKEFLYLIIKRLNIKKLRNHSNSEITFSPLINFIYGPNGAGKTTILEAIHICSFGKTFQPTQDNQLIMKGNESYSISCRCQTDLGTPYDVNVEFIHGKKKQIRSSLGENLSSKNLIGELPTVVLTPDYKIITSGSPNERRIFVDKILSQCSKIYLDDLIKFKKTLKQRNALLSKENFPRKFDENLFSSWTEQFIQLSSKIIYKRYTFAEEFPRYFQSMYSDISSEKEKVNLRYLPDSVTADKYEMKISLDFIYDMLRQRAKEIENVEKKRGLTLFGPQKDEFEILINDGLARDIASQGQHKTLLVSLKIAEYMYLKELNNETPVILFDDIFSELDDNRIAKVVKILQNTDAQSFITTVNIEKILSKTELNLNTKRLFIINGEVNETN